VIGLNRQVRGPIARRADASEHLVRIFHRKVLRGPLGFAGRGSLARPVFDPSRDLGIALSVGQQLVDLLLLPSLLLLPIQISPSARWSCHATHPAELEASP
jgi:hypothetical protein